MKWPKRLWEWLTVDDIADIMLVNYDLEKNELEVFNFGHQKYRAISGEYSSLKFDVIRKHCSEKTRIYIWAGMEKKHLAYCEPIKNYLENEKLLQTGQGYHWGSGQRYPEPARWKCPTCGKYGG